MKKTVSILVLLTMLTLFAFAGGQGEDPDMEGEGPVSISIITNASVSEPPADDNPVEQAIEDFTDTELDIQWFQGGTFENEILPARFASGDIPEVVGFDGSIRLSYMVNAMQDGLFWDITDKIRNYPNLADLGDTRITNASVDGRLYGVPRARPLVRRTFVYRRDWAEKLGIPEPTNVEEFYEMARAFTYDDPDGNGEDDTFGWWQVDGNEGHFGVIFGAPNNWAYIDGEMVKGETTEEYMQALQFQRRMYNDGLMHPEWPIMSRGNDAIPAFTEGRAGMFRFNVSGWGGQPARSQAIDPEADAWAFSVVEGPNGTFTIGERGYNGILAINKDLVETEEEVDRILEFFDAMGSEAMSSLMVWGLEGIHHEMDNGLAVPIESAGEDFNQDVLFPYRYTIIANWPEFRAKEGDGGPVARRQVELWQEMERYAKPDPTEPLFSETEAERGSDLDQILDDAGKRFITGQITEDQYWDAVDRWRDAGGEQMAKEFAEAYRANQ